MFNAIGSKFLTHTFFGKSSINKKITLFTLSLFLGSLSLGAGLEFQDYTWKIILGSETFLEAGTIIYFTFNRREFKKGREAIPLKIIHTYSPTISSSEQSRPLFFSCQRPGQGSIMRGIHPHDIPSSETSLEGSGSRPHEKPLRATVHLTNSSPLAPPKGVLMRGIHPNDIPSVAETPLDDSASRSQEEPFHASRGHFSDAPPSVSPRRGFMRGVIPEASSSSY